ncbi:MAG: hypothetical protein ABSE73_14180 [Planctomycetota bacterium]
MASFWSNRNLSGTRDAVLINGLATLAGCTGLVLAFVLDPEDQAFGPGLGVALSATGVLLVWSLTLAVRAWRRGERSRWGRAVRILGGLETVLLVAIVFLIGYGFPFSNPSQWFEWQWKTGMIVFLPVVGIAWLGATLVAWWRVRRAARRDAKEGMQGRSQWKRGLIWFCAVAALLVALLLPCPLFLYCAEWERYNDMELRTWRGRVLENTPVFVADTAAGPLALSSWAEAVELYQCALWSGRISKKRLLAEVNSTDQYAQDCAYAGLERADPQAALALADRIGQGRTSGTSPTLRGRAGDLMARRGTPERIRYFLDQYATHPSPSSAFMDSLLCSLSNRPEFLPELASFCRKDFPNRMVALRAIAAMSPTAKDLPAIWAGFLADRDSSRRRSALDVIPYIRDANARLAILVAGFESPDPYVRQETQWQCDRWPFEVLGDFESRDPALMKRLIQSLLPVLDDADRRIHCGAARSLSWLFDNHGTLHEEYTFFCILCDRLAGWQAVGDAPDEPKMLESVRAAARKWLDEHK